MSLCRFIPLASFLVLLVGKAAALSNHNVHSLTMHLPSPTNSCIFQHFITSTTPLLDIPITTPTETAIYTSVSDENENGPPVATIIGLVLGLSGLAVIFLFITIFLIQKRRRDKAEIVEVGQGRRREEEGAGLATSAAPIATGGRGF